MNSNPVHLVHRVHYYSFLVDDPTNRSISALGNYIDEALMMRDCVGATDTYYSHDNPVILIG